MASFSIEKEKITINLDCKNFNPMINEASFENDEYYYVFDGKDINCKILDDQIQVELNCKGKEIKTNQKYRLSLRFSGGWTYADIFFGNQTATIAETYPCENYGDIQIRVFNQSSAIGI